MLAQLQEGWKEIMGAPENVSHRASNRTVSSDLCVRQLPLTARVKYILHSF